MFEDTRVSEYDLIKGDFNAPRKGEFVIETMKKIGGGKKSIIKELNHHRHDFDKKLIEKAFEIQQKQNCLIVTHIYIRQL